MNEVRFNELIECVRQLKDKHETYESLKSKDRNQIKIEMDLLGIESVNDEFIDSIIKVFEVFKESK